MNKRSSPNFNERAGMSPRYIVLHYTGMRNAAEALVRLCDPQSQVSAHYVVEENGDITQLVDEKMRAWHAGRSFWRGISDVNSASIGIELVNPGHDFGYRAFPEAQIAALKELVAAIVARNNMAPETCLLAHSDIAPARKMDPGELFPWQELAQAGFGLWPAPDAQDFSVAPDSEVADLLGVIGYEVGKLEQTLRAFQRRYDPENLSGIANPQTVARLRALNRQLAYQKI
jgi:N-acetylmuramoyl-L-alanine amidase